MRNGYTPKAMLWPIEVRTCTFMSALAPHVAILYGASEQLGNLTAVASSIDKWVVVASLQHHMQSDSAICTLQL